MESSEPRFYFALPRLIAKLRGQSASRTEDNWLEANIVGAAVHVLVLLFFAQVLLGSRTLWQQVLFAPVVVAAVWLFWIVFFYLTSRSIKMLRAVGLFRHLPDVRIQSVLIGATVTAFAWQLRPLGYVWIAAVALNLLAAAILHANRAG
jgi:hypothetical protein